MGVLVVISGLFCLIAGGLAVTIDCDLSNGAGCGNNGPFLFTPQGSTNTWNSRCTRNYLLRVLPLNPHNARGYQCTFYMDVPHSNRYIYSIAEDPSVAWRTVNTAFVYGYGLKARVSSKTVPSANVRYQHWYLSKAHTHPDDNHNAYITYRVENNRIQVWSSSGNSISGGSNAFFRPKSKTSYIALNRRYNSPAGQGSGLCRVRCFTLSNFIIFAADAPQALERTSGDPTGEPPTESGTDPQDPVDPGAEEPPVDGSN